MWGCFLWLAMTTGARRGELCAMRWDQLDLDRAVLTIWSSIAQKNTHTCEKDTKTHQRRRIALDYNMVSLLRACRQQCEQDAAAVGLTLASTAGCSQQPSTTARGSGRPPSPTATRGCAPASAGT
jgi:integrase